MKRLGLLVIAALALLGLASCGGSKNQLVILNWGDYISEEVVEAFESEYDIKVKVVTTDSNEQMYTNVVNKKAKYDLVVPSDYMIHQMYENDLLFEIDFSKLTNYKENIYVSELQELMNSEDCKVYSGYYVPYFWGSLGIMYNKQNFPSIEATVLEHGWDVLFDHSLLPEGAKVGMYNSSRDALAAAELKLGYSLNTKNKTEIDACMDLLSNTNFHQWGTDDLKIKVSQGNLDVALVYSGDFFDAFYADLEAAEENVENYSIYAPTTNNVFFDGLVIPNTCTNVDMAHNFINFMLNHDNSYTNAEFVGYCPTIQSVYDEIMADEEGWGDVIAIDAYNPAKVVNAEGAKAEVYSYLGAETYEYIEDKFTTVMIR